MKRKSEREREREKEMGGHWEQGHKSLSPSLPPSLGLVGRSARSITPLLAFYFFLITIKNDNRKNNDKRKNENYDDNEEKNNDNDRK